MDLPGAFPPHGFHTIHTYFGALSGRLHTYHGCTMSACFRRIAVTGHWVQAGANETPVEQSNINSRLRVAMNDSCQNLKSPKLDAYISSSKLQGILKQLKSKIDSTPDAMLYPSKIHHICVKCNISINRGNNPWIPAFAGMTGSLIRLSFPRRRESSTLS